MSAKKNKAESTSESAPIKQLVLRREKVRDLGVQTGVNTGYLQGVYGRNPGGGGVAPSLSISQPSKIDTPSGT